MGRSGAGTFHVTARGLGPLAPVVALVVLLAGCGASPYTYVKNTSAQLFFKVPAGWHQLDQNAVGDATYAAAQSVETTGNVTWVSAFDGAPAPSANHIFASNTPQPIVLVETLDLTTSGQSALSFNAMRNLFLPVTDDARAQVTADSTLAAFRNLADTVVTRAHGWHGIHVIFTYSLGGGPLQAFDQTVLTNTDSTKLYVLLARCASDCYISQNRQIRDVVNSLTVGG